MNAIEFDSKIDRIVAEGSTKFFATWEVADKVSANLHIREEIARNSNKDNARLTLRDIQYVASTTGLSATLYTHSSRNSRSLAGAVDNKGAVTYK